MFRNSRMAVLLALTGLLVSGRFQAVDAADLPERPLIDILQSDASPADKAITCKRLAVYGTAEAVPALAPLLADPELASWARIALEAIPDPAADQALREAMNAVEGRLLVGVINSIGVRRDQDAVAGLIEKLGADDSAVASAAAVALGQIHDATATQRLQQALGEAPQPVRSAVAEGCILCAEALLAEGKNAEALALYDAVRTADVPQQRVLEATRGAILAQGAAGIPLLVEQLQSNDRRLFWMGLSIARELPGEECTAALVTEIERAPPERQAVLVQVLADRGDASVLPRVLELARAGSPGTRVAALSVVQRLGDATCVPTLLEIAAEDNEQTAQAAKATLESLSGDEVDRALLERLEQAQGPVRRALIELIGLRRIPAIAALRKAVEDSDSQIRAAALAALGETVDLDDLDVLLTRVVSPQNSADTPVAEKALQAACVRMPDRETCAKSLASAMSKAPLSSQQTLLRILSTMGGATALQAMDDAASSSQPELQDTASRLLGEWMSVDAAPVLLKMAKSSDDGRYQVRAIRGYIRLARQFSMPEEDRAQMCRTALDVAEREADKKLVLEVLQRYPSVDMLRLAVEAAKDPDLKTDAGATALAIAQQIGGSADAQQLLAQIGQQPVKITIKKAEYGAGGQWKDVTQTLQQQVRTLPLIVLPSSSYNAAFGGDPAPGVVKQLKVDYEMDGKSGQATFRENDAIILTKP